MTAALRWVTHKPSEPGYYWMKREGEPSRIVEIRDHKRSGLYIVQTGKILVNLLEEVWVWYGPLQEPPS